MKADLVAALAAIPRRDNTAYLRAVRQFREAIIAAEVHFDGPVNFELRECSRLDGSYTHKLIFTPVE